MRPSGGNGFTAVCDKGDVITVLGRFCVVGRALGFVLVKLFYYLYGFAIRTRAHGQRCRRCVRGCGSLTVSRVGQCHVPTDVALTRKLLRSKTKGDALTHGSGGRFNVGYNNS